MPGLRHPLKPGFEGKSRPQSPVSRGRRPGPVTRPPSGHSTASWETRDFPGYVTSVTSAPPETAAPSLGPVAGGLAGAPSSLVRAAPSYRAGGRGDVIADPLVFPGVVVLLVIAARLVDGDQLAGDLL